MIVDNNNFKSEVEDSKGFVFVDFYADWCVNVDDSPEIAQKYGIMSIPTFIVFKDGEEYKKHIGMCEKDYLLELIK